LAEVVANSFRLTGLFNRAQSSKSDRAVVLLLLADDFKRLRGEVGEHLTGVEKVLRSSNVLTAMLYRREGAVTAKSVVRISRIHNTGMLVFAADDVVNMVLDWALEYSERAKFAAGELTRDRVVHPLSTDEGGKLLAEEWEAQGATVVLSLLAEEFRKMVAGAPAQLTDTGER